MPLSLGRLVIDGIIEDISIDFELFASNGTPLRAKIGVSIKEQDASTSCCSPKSILPGNHEPATLRRRARRKLDPASKAAVPPTVARRRSEARRRQISPHAWAWIRVLGAELLDSWARAVTLSLKAGVSVDFSSSLSAGAGIGVSAGVEFDASASLEASFGLDASAGADVSAGFALSAAGGLGAALETVAIVQTKSAAADARRSFGPAVPPTPIFSTPAVNISAGATAVGTASIPAASTAAIHTALDIPPPTITPRPALPEQIRTPLQIAVGMPSRSQQLAAPSAPPPPLADPRATSFGIGVPLRPRVGSAADLRAGVTAGRIPLRPRAPVTSVLDLTNPSASALDTAATGSRSQRR